MYPNLISTALSHCLQNLSFYCDRVYMYTHTCRHTRTHNAIISTILRATNKSSPREATWEKFPLIETNFLTTQGMRVWNNWVKLKAKTQNDKQIIYGKNKVISWRCGAVLEGVQKSFWQWSVYSITWDEYILHGCRYWSRLSKLQSKHISLSKIIFQCDLWDLSISYGC